jgi:hypothetical protein
MPVGNFSVATLVDPSLSIVNQTASTAKADLPHHSALLLGRTHVPQSAFCRKFKLKVGLPGMLCCGTYGWRAVPADPAYLHSNGCLLLVACCPTDGFRPNGDRGARSCELRTARPSNPHFPLTGYLGLAYLAGDPSLIS